MTRIRWLISLLPMLGLLAGCATAPPVATPVAPPAVQAKAVAVVQKPSPAPQIEIRRCPTAADIARLRETRPKPLRERKMPTTTSARVAQTAAQLGLYEAQGQWADQVERAFRKCDER